MCTDASDRADREFLFIITYGRSGSTLLQGVLNSIPGYSITGENMDACQKLREFYTCIYNAISSHNHNNMPADSRNSWYNPIYVTNLKDACQDLLKQICDKSRGSEDMSVFGFKEIRYMEHLSDGDLEQYLDWLYSVFSAKFILLTRDKKETCKSKWHAKEVPSACKNRLQKFEDAVKQYIEDRPYQEWYHLDIGKLHDGVEPERFKDLILWLGEDFNKEKIKSVLEKKHGY